VKDLVINGFKFPNLIKARVAIAEFCDLIVQQSSPEHIARCKITGRYIGTSSYEWTWSVSKYYASPVWQDHKTSKYFVEYSKDSAWNKLWSIVDLGQFGSKINFIANEYTKQVADMLPGFKEEMYATKEKNSESRDKRMMKLIDRSHDFVEGDILEFKSSIWNLSERERNKLYWPDSQYEKFQNEYGIDVFTKKAVRYSPTFRGIYTATFNIKPLHYSHEESAVAIIPVQGTFKGLMYLDPRCLQKSK